MSKNDERERVARLTAARRAAADKKAAEVLEAVERMERAGAAFSVAAVAREARVSRAFVYNHPELLAAIDAARGRALAAEVERLKGENARLREELGR